MNIEEKYLALMTNKEIFTQIFLSIYSTVCEKYVHNLDYDSLITTRLKFNNVTDGKHLRSCIDLMEDTESAIINFYKYGLCINENEVGEKYLRLYGILNAVYLQIDTLIELIELFKIPDKKNWKTSLKSLKVYEVRNKIAAHTVSYLNSLKVKDSFRITQTSIKKSAKEIHIVSNNHLTEKVNLFEIINEYNLFAENLLTLVTEKVIKSLFPNKSKYQDNLFFAWQFASKRKINYLELTKNRCW